jgi:uncharacterized protein YkwD
VSSAPPHHACHVPRSRRADAAGTFDVPGRGALLAAIAMVIALTMLPTATSAADPTSAIEWDVLERVNRFRDHHGLRPLPMAPGVRKVAGSRSSSMIRHDYFGHVSPGGIDAGDLLRARGIRRSWAEVIGWTRNRGLGPGSRWMVDWWKRSPMHRPLLLSRRFDAAGVGVSREDGRAIWTIVFVG